MKAISNSTIIATSLAIFSMLFGAGNLIFPIKTGMDSGDKIIWGALGFLLTSTFLPVIGLVSILLFDGNCRKFFGRLGKIPGQAMIFFWIVIICPAIVMPRIVTLSYEMTSSFLPHMPQFIFSVIFLLITFLAAFKESKIIGILGYFVSPVLLVSLLAILAKGLLNLNPILPISTSSADVFWEQLKYGYNTVDLPGAIFFSSIVISILKKNISDENYSVKKIAGTGLTAGLIGSSILGVIYLGMIYIGASFGPEFAHLNEARIFESISFKILGSKGALLICIAVLMACFSTIIALAAVGAEYIQKTISNNRISYVQSLVITLLLTLIPSNFGFSQIIKFSTPILQVGYPALIVLTISNLFYSLVGLKPVKTPVFLSVLITLILVLT